MLQNRLERRQKSAPPRGLWIGRWEPFKAVDVLCEVAKRSGFQIDVYGTGLPELSAVPSNMRLMGTLASSEEVAFERYDFLIFTSYFEGMPNTVLEAAAVGLPIVASDVGGIRETFGDKLVKLVDMNAETSVIASGFVAGIAEIMAEKDLRHTKRCWQLRERVAEHHSAAHFRKEILALVEDQQHVD